MRFVSGVHYLCPFISVVINVKLASQQSFKCLSIPII